MLILLLLARRDGSFPIQFLAAAKAACRQTNDLNRARTIREWLTKGLLHQRDERGHIWLDGRRFVEWIKIESQAKVGKSMGDDEAYCLRCRQPVKLTTPTSTQRGKQILWQGVCPSCGNPIYRGGHCG